MNKSEIRKRNVKKIMRDRDLKGVDFARLIDRSPTQISAYFGTTSARDVGEEFARHIETRLNLERGALDIEDGNTISLNLFGDASPASTPPPVERPPGLSPVYIPDSEDAEKMDIEQVLKNLTQVRRVQAKLQRARARFFRRIESIYMGRIEEINFPKYIITDVQTGDTSGETWLKPDYLVEETETGSHKAIEFRVISSRNDVNPRLITRVVQQLPIERIDVEFLILVAFELTPEGAAPGTADVYIIHRSLIEKLKNEKRSAYYVRGNAESMHINNIDISQLKNVLELDHAIKIARNTL